jgi:hypothetical protein
MYLSAMIHGPKYNRKRKCHVEHLYGYGFHMLPKCWMGVRCLRDYPVLIELGVELWKKFKHHLDPASQVMPPNSVNVLVYVGAFGGKIRAHRDNAPNMRGVDPHDNSQVLGSSVMTFNLFDGQEVEFTRLDKTKVGSFQTEHGSVYILKALDDLVNKHSATFVGNRNGEKTGKKKKDKVRVSLVFRWLGRREEVACMDYEKSRQGCELHVNPNEVVRKMYPKNKGSQKVYKFKHWNDKAPHPPETVEATNTLY